MPQRHMLLLLALALLLAAVGCQATAQGRARPRPSSKSSPKPSPRPKPGPSPRPKPSPRPRPRPSPKPKPPPPPHKWVELSPAQRRRAEQLLSIFENSTLQPAYGYAENLRDGRGVTFGRSGFCTGTSDGLLVVRDYVRARPKGNPLARFLPILERIDRAGGGDSPLLAGPTQAAFIQAVKAASQDLLFRQAQDRLASRLYWEPSQRLAKNLGLRLPLAKAQLYDAYVQHGDADEGSPEYATSISGLAAWVSRQVGGSPRDGVDERLWLQRFLEHRRRVLLQGESSWADGVQRVDVYAWILQLGGAGLDRPIQLSWDRCRPDGRAGPCVPQPRGGPGALRIGGVVYGNFRLA